MESSHGASVKKMKNAPSKVEIACVEWLLEEYERAVLWHSYSRLLNFGWDYDLLRHGYETALLRIRSGEREEAGLALVDCILHFQKVLASKSPLPALTEKCAELLMTPVNRVGDSGSVLWFEMVHSWRSASSKGVPSVPDMARFMVVEALVSFVCVVIGLMGPLAYGRHFAWLVPPLFFGSMLIVVLTTFLKAVSMRIVVYLCVVFSVLYLAQTVLVSVPGGRALLLTGFGALVGAFIEAHLSFKRAVRLSTKYGPLACLWVRKHHKGAYELMLVDGNNDVIWHRYVRYLAWCVEPVLGTNQEMDLRSPVRIASLKTDIGSWFQCYPGLIGPRMVGLRRRNPADLDEVLRTSVGLSREMLDEYLLRCPSPLQPPHYDELKDNPQWHVSAGHPW